MDGKPGDRSDAEILADEAAHLPLNERVFHKVWKVRELAYLELGDNFESAPDDGQIFKEYANGMAKIARDSNAAAQVAGFQAIIKFAESAPLPIVRSTAKEIGKAIGEKGMNGRPVNKKRAAEAIVAMVGAECGQIIIEIFAAVGFKSKVAKVVVGTATAICDALSTYGKAHIPIKAICKHVPKLLGDKNKEVRAAGKKLAVLINYWTKEPAQTLIPGVKEVILKELEPLFAQNAKKSKPKATKLTRSKIKRVRKAGEAEEDESESEVEEEEEEEEDTDLGINLWERLQPMRVAVETDDKGKVIAYEQFPKAFQSDKWNHHKAAIDAAIEVIGENKIMAGTEADLTPRFRELLRKSKMAVVIASCARLAIALMLGLRKDLPRATARDCASSLILRLKETSRVVVEPVASALDLLHQKKFIKIYDFRNDIEKAAKIKSPKSRVNLLRWVARSISKGMPSADIKGEPLKFFSALFLDQTDDRSTEVRDAALFGISALQYLAGTKSTEKLVAKLDKQKQVKVTSGVTSIKEARKAEKANAEAGGKSEATPTKSDKAAKGSTKKGSATKRTSAKKTSAKKAKPKPAVYVSDDEGETGLSDEAALEAATARYEGFDAEQWNNKFAKARAGCAKLVNEIVSEKESHDSDESALLISLLLIEPGLHDSSFLAAKEKLGLLGHIAAKCSAPLPRKSLRRVLLPAIEKVGDIKCAKIAEGVLMSLAEATSARYFFQALSETAKETINARAQINIMKFAVKVIDDFGIPAVKPEDVAALVVTMLGKEGAPALKKATITLACQASIRTPRSFRDMLVSKQIDSDALETFDEEVTKYKNTPDAPSRKKRVFANVSAAVPEEEPAAPEPEPEPEPTIETEPEQSDEEEPSPVRKRTPKRATSPELPKELLRVSIAEHFTTGSGVLTKLQSKDWRTRGLGLEELNGIITAANSFIECNVGRLLLPLLKKRLVDSNVNVAAASYATTGRLITAMGPDSIIHLKVLMPTILEKGCTDIKKSVRSSAINCLNIWYDIVGMAPLVQFMHHPFKVKPDKQGRIRTDFLQWIIPRISGELGGFVPEQGELEPLIRPCIACLQDNITAVRHLAENLLDVLVMNVGYEAIEVQLPEKQSVLRQLEPVLQKYANSAPVENPSAPSATPVARTPRRSVRRTPRTSVRSAKRPQSMMLTPRTPGMPGRLFDPGSAQSGRRRPMSIQVPSGYNQGIGFEEEQDEQVLIPNANRGMRSEQYMLRKRRSAEEAVEEGGDGSGTVSENLDDLVADLKDCVSPLMFEKLTAPANRFQFHIEAMTTIKSFMIGDPETTVSVADVLLRWAAFRIEDSRTPSTVLTAIADFVNSICEVLLSSDIKLSEYEASALVPAIVGKCGSSREPVRNRMLHCLLAVGEVIPGDIMLVFLSSSLQRPIGQFACEEVAKEICQLIDRKCGSGAGLPVGVLPVIARVTYGEDEVAGRAAASCISRAHFHFGDDLWGLLGPLTDEQARLIEERLAQANNIAHQVEPSTPTPMGSPPASHFIPSTPVGVTDIRPSDYRLSVAPQPAASVQSTIRNVLSTRTPAKIRPAFGRSGSSEGPTSSRRISRVLQKPDSADTVAYVLHQLQDPDRDEQLDGLSVLYSDLQLDDSKLRQLPSEVIPKLSKCFIAALTRIENMEGNIDDPLILKRFLNAIMAYAREPEIIVLLNQEGMEKILNDLLHAMVPDEVRGIQDWKQVRRGVNLVLLKILEACTQNMLFSSLIHVLSSSIAMLAEVHDVASKSRISSKCSFCINSIAKAVQKGFGTCNIEDLLKDMHEFLLANPVRPQAVETSEEQTIAIRLLKTIVDKLIAEVGLQIKDHLRKIGGENSQLARYIEMKLNDGTIDIPVDEDVVSGDGLSESDDEDVGRTTPDPEAIARAKRLIRSGSGRLRGGPGRIPSSGPGSGQVYLRRLKEIQERYGLQTNNTGSSVSSSSTTDAGSSASDSTSNQPSAAVVGGSRKVKAESMNRAAALRERMARIRAGQES